MSELDPETLSRALSEIGRKGGKVGGLAKVPKGLATLPAAERERIRLKGLETRRRKAAERLKSRRIGDQG